MANPVKVVPASASDIAKLGEWYRLADTEPQDLDGSIEGLSRAHADGYLGYATGHGPKANLRRMVSLDFRKWFHARSTLRTLSRNGQTIGILAMGPPRTVWTELADRAEAAGAAGQDDQTTTIDQLVVMAFQVAKIYLLGVHPDHQNRGHGSHLIRYALESARQDNLLQIYGQYEGERGHLRRFYEMLGFAVLEQGEQLSLEGVVSGITLFARPTERFFVWQRPVGFSGGVAQGASPRSAAVTRA
jgi:ribosomal protein S18 acetylase RimI-like enzyme